MSVHLFRCEFLFGTRNEICSKSKVGGETNELECGTEVVTKVVALTSLRLIYHQRSGAFKIVLQCGGFVKGNIHGVHS